MPASLVTPSTSWAMSSPKSLAHVVERGARVLDGVVQQRGAERLGVEAHAGADLRDADRVGDELLAATCAAGRRGARRRTRTPPDALEVDRLDRVVGVLGDDREAGRRAARCSCGSRLRRGREGAASLRQLRSRRACGPLALRRAARWRLPHAGRRLRRRRPIWAAGGRATASRRGPCAAAFGRSAPSGCLLAQESPCPLVATAA